MLKSLVKKIEKLTSEELVGAIEAIDKNVAFIDGDSNNFEIFYTDDVEECGDYVVVGAAGYSCDRKELEKILFREILMAYGIEANFATWAFYHVDEANVEVVIEDCSIEEYIEFVVAAKKAAETQKALQQAQQTQQAINIVANFVGTEEISEEIVEEFLEGASITTAKDLMSFVKPSNYVWHTYVGVMGQKNNYRFLVIRNGELMLIETSTCYGAREVSNNGTLMGQEWYDLPLEPGDLILALEGFEGCYNQDILQESNEIKVVFETPIVWSKDN